MLSQGERILRQLVAAEMPDWPTEYNVRPDWLVSRKGRRLELDIWIPLLRLAIEYQGWQHFVAGGSTGVSRHDAEIQRVRDLQKAYICRDNGVYLYGVTAPDLQDEQRFKADLWKWVAYAQSGQRPRLMRVPPIAVVTAEGTKPFNPHLAVQYNRTQLNSRPKLRPTGAEANTFRKGLRWEYNSVAKRMGWNQTPEHPSNTVTRVMGAPRNA